MKKPSRLLLAVAGTLAVAGALGWILTFDGSSTPGRAVFGGYRDRWFLINLAVSYAAVVAGWLAFARPQRSTVFKVLALHLGLLLAILMLELPAVFGVFDYRTVFGGVHAVPGQADARLRRAGRPHARYEGEVIPDLVEWLDADAEPIVYVFETDKYGLRNPTDKLDPAVLCLGDSVLVAGLLGVDDIVTEQLERRLGDPVLNVSEVGYSPQEAIIRLDTTGLDLRDRLVAQFIFEGNDLGDSRAWRAWSRRSMRSDWPTSGLIKNLVKLLQGPRRQAGTRRTGVFNTPDGAHHTVHFLYDAGRMDSADEWRHVREALAAARRDIETRGGRYALVFIPSKITVLHPYCTWPKTSELDDPAHSQTAFRTDFAAFCRSEGIQHLDLTDALRAAAQRGQLPYFPADTHLNARGHEIIAETLARWIGDLREHSGESPG